MKHPSHVLFERFQSLFDSFPPGVKGIPHQIQGRSFFPAGVGVYREPGDPLPDFPVGGVMVLGHNWGSVQDYDESSAAGAELNYLTWVNLRPFLREAGIDPKQCFFTNFFVGLLDRENSEGEFPGRRDPEFVQRCQALFGEQIELQKPRLVLVLGSAIPEHLAAMSQTLAPLGQFKAFPSFAELDRRRLACFTGVQIRGSSHTFSLVLLVHSCRRHANARSRRWGAYAGAEAEVAMVRHHLGLELVAATPPTTHAHAFGLVLRELREAGALTQEQLAQKAQLTREQIARLEDGAKSPSLDEIISVAGGLGTQASELVARMEVVQRESLQAASGSAAGTTASRS